MNNAKIEKLVKALGNAGVHRYRQESYIALYDAQRNLSGRTHYVDAQTLKYFNARVNYAYPEYGGLLYTLCESVQHPTFGRVHRFVVFDIFGNVISPRTEDDSFKKTSRQAIAALKKWISEFDAIVHTKKAAGGLAVRLTTEAKNLKAAAK